MNQQPPNPEGQYSPNPYTQNPGQFPQSGQNYPQQPPPGYPYPQQPQKKKPGIFKIGCGVLVGVVVLIVIIAIASGGKSNTGEKVNTTSNNSTSSQPPSKPTNQHYKVGDTVKVGDKWQVVVNSVKTDTGGEYSTLKQGNVYLLIDVSLNNISKEEQNTSSIAEWKLTDTAGQAYTTTFFSGAPPAPDGKVEAGAPAKGTLAYEVPATTKEFRLAFTPSLFSSGQTIWDLTVS